MRAHKSGSLAFLALLAVTGISHGQFTVVNAPQDTAGQFTLVSEGPVANGPTGLFLEGPPTVPLPGDPGAGAVVGGNVGGRGPLSHLGTLEFGFDYLKPFWSFRDFTLAVPAASAGSFPLLGDTGHVDDHFTFQPRLKYHYDFTDAGVGVGASGTFLSLTGNLQRTIGSTATGLGDLSADSHLTIVVANLAELTKDFNWGDLARKHDWQCCDCLEDIDMRFSIGSRYSSIDQAYTGTLSSSTATASNKTTRHSTQNFAGLGLTSALDVYKPVSDHWSVFTGLRGSVLIGDNKKESALSVDLAGQPGTSSSISNSDTALIPIAETTLGVEWSTDFADELHPDKAPVRMTVRAAAVGAFWGDVGPLSAGSSQGFRSSDLFLVGATVAVGLYR